MPILIQAIIAAILVVPSYMWCMRQLRLVSAARATVQVRSVILKACGAIIHDDGETQNCKQLAARLARLSLNDRLLFTIANANHEHVAAHHAHKFNWPAKNDENRKIIEATARAVSLMALAYHPSLGKQARQYLNSIRIEKSAECEKPNTVEMVKPPKSLKNSSKEMIEAVWESVTNKPIAA